MDQHCPIREIVGAMEKALADDLAAAGYEVLNKVSWKPALDAALWEPVRTAFAAHFPRLASYGLDRPAPSNDRQALRADQ